MPFSIGMFLVVVAGAYFAGADGLGWPSIGEDPYFPLFLISILIYFAHYTAWRIVNRRTPEPANA